MDFPLTACDFEGPIPQCFGTTSPVAQAPQGFRDAYADTDLAGPIPFCFNTRPLLPMAHLPAQRCGAAAAATHLA